MTNIVNSAITRTTPSIIATLLSLAPPVTAPGVPIRADEDPIPVEEIEVECTPLVGLLEWAITT